MTNIYMSCGQWKSHVQSLSGGSVLSSAHMSSFHFRNQSSECALFIALWAFRHLAESRLLRTHKLKAFFRLDLAFLHLILLVVITSPDWYLHACG
jgi:hypothetical protein